MAHSATSPPKKWEAFEGSYSYGGEEGGSSGSGEEVEEGEANVRRRLWRTRIVRRLVETGSATGAEAGFCEDCAYLDPDIAVSSFPDALVQCAKDLEPKRCDTLKH